MEFPSSKHAASLTMNAPNTWPDLFAKSTLGKAFFERFLAAPLVLDSGVDTTGATTPSMFHRDCNGQTTANATSTVRAHMVFVEFA